MRFSQSVWNPSAFPPSLACRGKAGFCHKGWLIKDHPPPFSLNPQVNPPQILQTGKAQAGALQLQLHICFGWKARLLSGTSESVLWVQLPSFRAGDDLVSKAPVLQDEVTDTSGLPVFMYIKARRQEPFVLCYSKHLPLLFLPWVDQEGSLCLTLTLMK